MHRVRQSQQQLPIINKARQKEIFADNACDSEATRESFKSKHTASTGVAVENRRNGRIRVESDAQDLRIERNAHPDAGTGCRRKDK